MPNVGNNTLTVPKPGFVIWLITLKVIIVILRTKNKFSKTFRENFCYDPNGIQDWIITLIEQVVDQRFIRQRENFRAHIQETFYRNGFKPDRYM